MMDDYALAQVAAAAGDDSAPWTHTWDAGDIAMRLVTHPDRIAVIAFHGSQSVHDWMHDLTAVPHSVTDHPELGPVHAGFAEGLDEILHQALPTLPASPVIVGHSLGGARALIFGALLVRHGIPPARIVTFGAPRPGFTPLADVLAPIRITAYRNGTLAMPTIAGGDSRDIVTDLPLHIPVIAPYIHPREPLTDVSAPPAPDDAWGPFGWHHMGLYLAALRPQA